MANSDTIAVLYGFWGSSCSWRVRAALHYKQIPFEERSIDIFGEKKQLSDEYKAINPMQKVPALVIDGVTLVESMAIIQYLEDTRPYPPLMPTTALQRARVREICEVMKPFKMMFIYEETSYLVIVSGIQPLQSGLRRQLDSDEQYTNFAIYWIVRGLQTLEELLKKSAGKYCVGDNVSLADICFVPQVFNAVERYKLDLKKYATVSKIYDKLLDEEFFRETHPDKIQSTK